MYQVILTFNVFLERNPVFYDGNNSDVGFGQGFLGTAIQVVLGLFAFSLLISVSLCQYSHNKIDKEILIHLCTYWENKSFVHFLFSL